MLSKLFSFLNKKQDDSIENAMIGYGDCGAMLDVNVGDK